MNNSIIDEDIKIQLFMSMYRLYHLSIAHDVYNEENYKNIEFDVPETEDAWQSIFKAYNALKWADENPEYDFASIMSNHTYSNEDILYFLRRKYKNYANFLNEQGRL